MSKISSRAASEINNAYQIEKERQNALSFLATCKCLELLRPKKQIRVDRFTIESEGFQKLMKKIVSKKIPFKRTQKC